MSYGHCLDAIVKASGDTLSKKEANDLLQEMGETAERLKRESDGIATDAKLREFAASAGERKKFEAAQAKKHAILAAMKFEQGKSRLTELRGGGLSWLNSFRAIMHGMNQRAVGVRDSAMATMQAYEKRYLGSVMSAIAKERPHLEALLFRTRGFGLGMRPTKAAEAFNNRVIKEMETPGSTGDADAAWLGQLYGKVTEMARRDLNRLGASIGKLEGQGWFPHSHEADRIRTAPQMEWVGFIMDRLDLEGTYKGLTDGEITELLKDLWTDIVTGQDLNPTARGKGDFRAPANMAKALGERRFLKFKSSDSFIEYNDRFGKGTATAAIFEHLQASARYAGMMDTFGPNPELMIGRLAEWAQMRVRADETVKPQKREDIVAALRQIDQWGAWKVLTGKSDIPQNRSLARASSGTRAWLSAAKLMGAVLSALPTDPVMLANNLRFQGKPLLAAFARTLQGYLRGRGSGEQRYLGFLLGEGYEALTGNALDRYSAYDSPAGRMSWLATVAMKIQGLSGFTDVGRAVGARIMAADMGHHAGSTWADLPIRYRNVLELQGIDATRWDVLRAAAHTGENGTRYVDPDSIARLPDEQIDRLIGDRLDDAEKAVRAREGTLREADAREAAWVEKRYGKFRERFARSRAYLETVRGRMDEAAQKRVDKLQERMDGIAGRLSEIGEAYARLAPNPQGRARRIGRDEGRLGEVTKGLRSDMREIGAEVKARSSELGGQYQATWERWQADLEAFAGRIDERQKARAEELAAMPERHRLRIEQLREQARVDLEIDYRRFIADEAGYGIIMPDVRTRKVITWGGQQSGSAGGEVARFLMQFKSFPVAFQQRILGRNFRSGPDYGSRSANIMHGAVRTAELMSFLFVGGLLAAWSKDIARGQSPKDLVDEDGEVRAKVAIAAMMQGGGLGIYGDFLFGQYNRIGKGLAETLGGPAPGTFGDMLRVMQGEQEWLLGERKKAPNRGKATLDLVLGNTPFINLWYTRSALDYLFLSSLREAASPGSRAREEKRLREETGQRRLAEPMRPFQ